MEEERKCQLFTTKINWEKILCTNIMVDFMVSLACQGFRNPGEVVVSSDDMWIGRNNLSVSDKM